LTPEQHEEIARRRLAGERLQALADEFGITRQGVDLIAKRRSRPADPAAKPQALTPDQFAWLKQQLQTGTRDAGDKWSQAAVKKLVAVGSVVLPGDPIAMIAQQDFKLRLRVPERHARFLKAGDRIRIDGAEFGEQASKSGAIDLVYPQIEDGRVVADATVEGLGEYFVGNRLRVWISGGPRTALVIPSNYVTTRFGIDYVHIRQAERTIDVPVQRGRDLPSADLPNGLEILSGIRAGDQLVQP